MTGRAKGWAALAAAGMALASAGARAAPADATPAPRLAEPAAAQGTLNAQMAALEAAPHPAAPADDGRSAAVSHRVVEAAGAFHGYTRRASALSAHFENGGGVAHALTVGAGYEPTQLAAGAAAYGMLAALQDFAFVSAVRDAAPSPAARAALAQRLQADPSAVLDIPGADETALRIAQLLGRRGADLAASGEAVRKAAYAVQKEAWSKGAIEHAPERLAAVKTMSATPATLAAADQDELMSGLVALRTSPAYRAQPGARPTPIVARAMAAAAVTALGFGGEDHGDEMMKLLSDARGVDCLKMAKLNLYQCLAVAGPHYEDMFCLGRHAMADTGQCLTTAAGWTGPLETAPVLTRAALPLAVSAAPGSVAVPMAVAALDGPERAGAFAAPVVAAEPAAPAEPPAPPPAPTRAELAAAVAAPEALPPAAPVQVARADLPSFTDVARAAPPPRDDATADEPPPAPRDYARATDDDGYASPPRRAYAPAYDGGSDGDAAPAPRARAWGRAPAYGEDGPAPWGAYPASAPAAYGPAGYGPGYPPAYGGGYGPYGYPGGMDGR
ncbi:MAG: hypothetical protein INR64_12530 [Caulobacteraceae bacterium]|nr:hypothetical protein [Caulobacter sp.]